MGSDLIRLTGLRASGYHGVFDWEKEDPQPFVVDTELSLDLRKSGRSDDLADTVSYADLADLIEQAITGESFDLIEALADHIARSALLADSRVQTVAVTVHKPQAPLSQSFQDVSVTVSRSREDIAGVDGQHPMDQEQPHGKRISRGAEDSEKPEEITSVYEGELVEESAASAASPEEETGRFVTRTARLGPYDRMSLSDLAESGTAAEPDPAEPATAESDSARWDIVEVDALESDYGESDSEESPPVETDVAQVISTEPFRDPDLSATFPVRAVLALGSNLGDSRHTLTSAVRALDDHDDVVLVAASPVARTKPVGGPVNQRYYLNQVVEIETRLSPHALLDLAQQTEAEHNRLREERWGPRTLDVDIVTYAGALIDSPRLQVPHPSAAERAFVLLPWSWMDPVALLNGRPVRELAREATDFDEVRRLDEEEPSQGQHR